MDFYQSAYMALPGITPEEFMYLKQATVGLSEQQTKDFFMVYSSKRKNPTEILLFTLAGLLGIAGIQRLIVGQIGMGLLYFFTFGLCFIGTIIDIFNHKQLALEFNQKMVFESLQLIKMGAFSNG